MAIIRLKGGLGNQLFQYAHGRNSMYNGEDIIFDISFFGNKSKKYTVRDFKLDKFNIPDSIVFINKKYILRNYIEKIKKKLGYPVEEYFQGEQYFADVADILRKEFTLKNSMSPVALMHAQHIKDAPHSVSLHIRRGDYVTDPRTYTYHGVCGIDYYEGAIEYVQNMFGNIVVFVFSDDIKWAKKNVIGKHVIYVSRPDIKDTEELILMSKCKHNIIANSTFSWWGAWINDNPDKIVIAPKKWFNDEERNKQSHIIPSAWIRL